MVGGSNLHKSLVFDRLYGAVEGVCSTAGVFRPSLLLRGIDMLRR